MKVSKNHNSLGLDVIQSPNVQDAFQPIPGMIHFTAAIVVTVNSKKNDRVGTAARYSNYAPSLKHSWHNAYID